MSQDLGSFEGRNEVASTIKIMRAGDGLSTPLAAEPRGWAQGDRLPVLLWTTVGKITHEPASEGRGVVRLHILNTDEAAVLDHVDESLLDGLLSSQRERVALYEADQQRLKDEAKGVHTLPLGDTPDDDEGVPVRPEGMSDEDWESSLPRGDWQADAAVTPPTPISGRKRRGAAEG